MGITSHPAKALTLSAKKPSYLKNPRSRRFRIRETTRYAFLRPWADAPSIKNANPQFDAMEASMSSTYTGSPHA